MNAPFSPEQAILFHPGQPDRAAGEIETLRHAAIRARNEALALSLRTGFARIGRGLALLGATLRSWPTRRRTYENLRSLTDRELADIGIGRGDIARVFEPGFRVSGQAVAAPRRAAALHA